MMLYHDGDVKLSFSERFWETIKKFRQKCLVYKLQQWLHQCDAIFLFSSFSLHRITRYQFDD